MSNILIDTSVLVDYLRRQDSERSFYVSLLKQGHTPCISIVTHTELYSGKSVWEQPELLAVVNELCAGMDICPYDTPLSEEAGKLRARFELDFVDAIIAATAFAHNTQLATLNVKDFKRVKGLSLFAM